MSLETLPWHLPPGWPLILGGLALALLPVRWRAWLLPLPALLALIHLERFDTGAFGVITMLGQKLVLARLDALAWPFAWLFAFAALVNSMYLRSRPHRREIAAGLIYAGTAMGAVCAGDLLSLFLYWELTALASTLLLIPYGAHPDYGVALRYLVVQVLSGVLLLGGVILHLQGGGTLSFDALSLGNAGNTWILAAFAIKAAFPLLHGWVVEAYPAASPAGTVFLSAFTTKLAIYALARGFTGTALLIPVGAVMILFTLILGLREDDLRRTLVYGLINQLGFMVMILGIGTPLAQSAAVAHAISHVLYSGLLFMALGVILLRTGTTRASALGGLGRQMPWTFAFCLLGTFGMAAPLFAGFASKSLILAAADEAQRADLWWLLMLGSIGIFIMAGLKVIYFAFLGPTSNNQVADAPRGMRQAMLLTTLGLLMLGCRPNLLYQALPHVVEYTLYTPAHIVEQLLLLSFAAIVFALALRWRLLPKMVDKVWDVDHLQRAVPGLWFRLQQHLAKWRKRSQASLERLTQAMTDRFALDDNEESGRARHWQTGTMALWVAISLAGYLLLYYFV